MATKRPHGLLPVKSSNAHIADELKMLAPIRPMGTTEMLGSMSLFFGNVVENAVLPALRDAIEYASVRGDGTAVAESCTAALTVLENAVKDFTGREPRRPSAPAGRDD